MVGEYPPHGLEDLIDGPLLLLDIVGLHLKGLADLADLRSVHDHPDSPGKVGVFLDFRIFEMGLKLKQSLLAACFGEILDLLDDGPGIGAFGDEDPGNHLEGIDDEVQGKLQEGGSEGSPENDHGRGGLKDCGERKAFESRTKKDGSDSNHQPKNCCNIHWTLLAFPPQLASAGITLNGIEKLREIQKNNKPLPQMGHPGHDGIQDISQTNSLVFLDLVTANADDLKDLIHREPHHHAFLKDNDGPGLIRIGGGGWKAKSLSQIDDRENLPPKVHDPFHEIRGLRNPCHIGDSIDLPDVHHVEGILLLAKLEAHELENAVAEVHHAGSGRAFER